MNADTACDVVEIQMLIAAYAAALDEKDYDALDDIFQPSALFVYHGTDGSQKQGSFKEMKPWIKEVVDEFPVTQHLMGLPVIRVDGHSATARSTLFNPLMVQEGDAPSTMLLVGAYYRDVLAKIDGRWWITERYDTGTWDLSCASKGS
ncbi:nuclear transport factor 2 family protein [Sphingobium nicotianae]|uniref:Nuclear transport factor 2 family protein n=1 Tax=Sphingobium nicotianae TaxID=2782607 RepID=A0A9X1IPE0_9SPHN|nr:nuclear transport factor 2 family protein [Sphingobium nicotianae]MBT2186042.1 nuclear transport factor 2 family protein [Sphingobium nicotianae]